MLNKKLIKAIKNSWGPDTNGCNISYEDWKDAYDPSTGQCIVTSLLIHELFGGELIYSADGGHMWNKLPDGSIVDLTSDQFGEDFKGFNDGESMSREEALHLGPKNTRPKRYDLLKTRTLERLSS
jgi:hypothetical protein